MKKFLMVALTALCILQATFVAQAGNFNDQGVFQGTVSAEVSALFAQNPAGGQALADAISALLIANPLLADDVAQAAVLSNNAAVQTAAGTGMGDALDALTRACSTQPCSEPRVAGPSRIARAIRLSKNATILAAAVAAAPAFLTADGAFIPPATFVAINRTILTALGLCTGSPC